MAIETVSAPVPVAPGIDVPAGYWQREASHAPRPLTPLGSSIFLDGLNQSFPKLFERFGILLETLEFREIGGHVYNAVVPIGGNKGNTTTLPPKPVLWLALRLHPAYRKRLKTCERAIAARTDVQILDRWLEEWRPRLIGDIARLRAVDVSAMSDRELGEHLVELKRWTFEAFDMHFLLSGSYGWPIAQLTFFMQDMLGWDDLQVMRLFSGLSEASSAPAIALVEVAEQMRADDVLRDSVLKSEPRDVDALIATHGGRAAEAYARYVHEWAFRALRYEVVEPSMHEQPEIVGRLLQDELRRPRDLHGDHARLEQERAEAERAALDALQDEEARRRFSTLLHEAQRVYPTREDNEFFTVSVPLALMRRAILEAGRRLVKNDVLAIEEDVFFLRIDEVSGALQRPPSGDALALLAEARRRDFDAAQTFDAPPSYGQEPPEPPLSVLPPIPRAMMRTFKYISDRVFEAETDDERAHASAGDAREVRGRPAARGTYTGTVRLVMGEHEFDKLQPGDVLVCPITSPVWSVLFASVGALVTDSGGVLSHPAIIAREYGIPAVVATRTGTARLRDGMRVTVDGDAGVVRIDS